MAIDPNVTNFLSSTSGINQSYPQVSEPSSSSVSTPELKPISKDSKDKITAMLDQKHEITAKNEVITNPFTTREFFNAISADPKIKVTEIYPIGGAVPGILGDEYIASNVKEITIEERATLQKELSYAAPDIDYRIMVESDDPIRDLLWIENAVIMFFAKQHKEYQEENSYPAFESFRKHGFTKLKHCNDGENHFLIMTIHPKDSCPIEFTFACKMKSHSLVDHHGLKLPILAFLKESEAEIVPCELDGFPLRSLEARVKKILGFGPDVNKQGWFKIHLWMLLGYFVDHPERRKQLTIGYGETASVSDILNMLKHTLDNHPVENGEKLLLLNIAYSLRTHLSDDQLTALAEVSPLLKHRAIFPILELIGTILSVQEPFGTRKIPLTSKLIISEYPSVQLNFEGSGNSLYTQHDLNPENAIVELESLLITDVETHFAQGVWDELIGLIPLRDKKIISDSMQTFKVDCEPLLKTLNKKMFSPHPLVRLITFYLLCYAQRMKGETDLEQQIGMMVPGLMAVYPNKRAEIAHMASSVLGEKFAYPIKSISLSPATNEIQLIAHWIEACQQSSRVTLDLQFVEKCERFSSLELIQLVNMLSGNALLAKAQLLKEISPNEQGLVEPFLNALITLMNEMTNNRAMKPQDIAETRTLVAKMIIKLNRTSALFSLNSHQREVLFSYLFSLVNLTQDEAIKELLLAVSIPNSPLFLQQQVSMLWDEFMSKSLLESKTNWTSLATLHQSLNLPKDDFVFSFLFLEAYNHINTGELDFARKAYGLLISYSTNPRQKILLKELLVCILRNLFERASGWDMEQAYTMTMLSYFKQVIDSNEAIKINTEMLTILFRKDASYANNLEERILLMILSSPLDMIDPKANFVFCKLAAKGILKVCQGNLEFSSSNPGKLQNIIPFIISSFEKNGDYVRLIRFFQVLSYFDIEYSFESDQLAFYVQSMEKYLIRENNNLATQEVFKLLLCWCKNGSPFQNHPILNQLYTPTCEQLLKLNQNDPFFDAYAIPISKFLLTPSNIEYISQSLTSWTPLLTSLVNKLALDVIQNEGQNNTFRISLIFDLLQIGSINDINLWFTMLNLGLKDETVDIRMRQAIVKDFISVAETKGMFDDQDQKVRAMCWSLFTTDLRLFNEDISSSILDVSCWLLGLYEKNLGDDFAAEHAPGLYQRICLNLKDIDQSHWRKLLVLRETIERLCSRIGKPFPSALHKHTYNLVNMTRCAIDFRLCNKITCSMNKSLLMMIQEDLTSNLDDVHGIIGNILYLWNGSDLPSNPLKSELSETLEIFQNHILAKQLSIRILVEIFRVKLPIFQDETIALLEVWCSHNLSKPENLTGNEIEYLLSCFMAAAGYLKGDNLYRLAVLALNLYTVLDEVKLLLVRAEICRNYFLEEDVGKTSKFSMLQHMEDYVRAYPDSFNDEVIKKLTYKLGLIAGTIQVVEFEEFLAHFEELLVLKKTDMLLDEFINIVFPELGDTSAVEETRFSLVVFLYEKVLLKCISKEDARQSKLFIKELFCRYLFDWIEIYPNDKQRDFHFRRAEIILKAIPNAVREEFLNEFKEYQMFIQPNFYTREDITKMLYRFLSCDTIKGMRRFCFAVHNLDLRIPFSTTLRDCFSVIFLRDPREWISNERDIDGVYVLARAFKIYLESLTSKEKEERDSMLSQFHAMLYKFLIKVPKIYQSLELCYSMVWACVAITKVYSNKGHLQNISAYIKHVDRTLQIVSEEFKKFSLLENDKLNNYLFALKNLLEPIITNPDSKIKAQGYTLCDKYLRLVSDQERNLGELSALQLRNNVVRYFNELADPKQFDRYFIRKLGQAPLREAMAVASSSRDLQPQSPKPVRTKKKVVKRRGR